LHGLLTAQFNYIIDERNIKSLNRQEALLQQEREKRKEERAKSKEDA